VSDEPVKRPSLMRWISGGCAVLFFLCLGAGGVVYWHVESLLERQFAPLVNRHLAAMVKGDWAAAYDMMSPEYQKKTPLEEFKKQWGRHIYLSAQPSFHADSLLRGDAGMVLTGTLSFHKPGEAEAKYDLVLGNATEADRISGFEWSK